MLGLPTSVRRPSRDHISKPKQDRPIVTVEHYVEVGTADFVATFRSSPKRPHWEILV